MHIYRGNTENTTRLCVKYHQRCTEIIVVENAFRPAEKKKIEKKPAEDDAVQTVILLCCRR